MQIVNSILDSRVIACLMDGGVVVARTDTLYGVLARADDEQAVTRVFALKGRSDHKSPIVLVADVSQLYDSPCGPTRDLCEQKWPGPVSVIVPSVDAPKWLRRENDSVAYRLPFHDELQSLLRQTGPLIAPSANPEGRPPASDVSGAISYFGDGVDIYIDSGRVEDAQASQLYEVDSSGNVQRLR